MHIREKLNTLTSETILSELNDMLKRSTVMVTWTGKRLISVEGFEGAVKIDDFSIKYLKQVPQVRLPNYELRERLMCLSLWNRIRKLYTDSDTHLLSRTIFTCIFQPARLNSTLSPNYFEPRKVLDETTGTRPLNKKLFEFTPEEFRTLWPNEENRNITGIRYSLSVGEIWVGSRSMVESAATHMNF